ncbi:MAG: preprotein translocase subunit SecA [Planctomycetota bacterium]|nr:MAG: preprotein translocase subunit SecA [Planctomycetota bacterium]REJ87569.1 MAG: preprotein translocase subunit SecA [Planctomycetota bacterium]
MSVTETITRSVRLAAQLSKSRLSRWQEMLPAIAAQEDDLKALSDYQLRKSSLALRHRAKSGEPLDDLLIEGFAIVREAGRRTLHMRHFDVQLLGGMAMHNRSIAEMQTGEGKTLTATLPMYMASLTGKGALLATVNDYLATRDAEWMRPLYQALGVSVGVIESNMPPTSRAKAYQCDVTYGTAKEFGFDFLRDRLVKRQMAQGSNDFLGRMLGTGGAGPMVAGQIVQRPMHFALVDEADSILIDDARTPLIIGAAPSEAQKLAVAAYKWSAESAHHFVEDEHYEYDHEKKSVELTAEGRRLVRNLPKPPSLDELGMVFMYDYIERAIRVWRDMILDRHYIVRDGEIVIVDEFTGRLAEGRRWQAGIHQAIEAKEGLEVTVESGQAARITVQDFFGRFPRLAGMTGTAATAAGEMKKIYGLHVVQIPTNRPPQRMQLDSVVCGTSEEKWDVIVDEICEVHATGRPVLIGTRSIDKSHILSERLTAAGIPHQVLNANRVAEEADIVAQAGQPGRITVSTNMAGRGTDIKLEDSVAAGEGLHVICTEMHESARIDRQLIGRCGRQGDPGTYRMYFALDDELLRSGLGAKAADRLKQVGSTAAGPFDSYERLFSRAQRRVERRHFRDRKALLYFERERKKVQRQMGQDPYLDTPG